MADTGVSGGVSASIVQEALASDSSFLSNYLALILFHPGLFFFTVHPTHRHT